MQYLNGTYTQRVNQLHRWDGPVFRGRFTSKLIRDETRLPYILAYIHLNPLRANLVTRIDAKGWTSLRAYLGRKNEPDWLFKDYFLDLFGEGKALREYTLALHRGRRNWPETMDLEFGFFKDKPVEQAAERHRQAHFESRFIEPSRLLNILTEVTGVSLSGLKKSLRGPQANPARRFAVWAFRRHTLLKNREIGRLLNMSYHQVSNVLSRFENRKEEMKPWIDELNRYVTNDGV